MALLAFNTLFLVAYLLSALVQYNDPDALPWIAIYLAATAMCVAEYLKKQPTWLPPLLAGITGLWIALRTFSNR